MCKIDHQQADQTLRTCASIIENIAKTSSSRANKLNDAMYSIRKAAHWHAETARENDQNSTHQAVQHWLKAALANLSQGKGTISTRKTIRSVRYQLEGIANWHRKMQPEE